MEPRPWGVVAHNTATTSQNKIHDDDVARKYGFRGGLVPGVDDYAYLSHVPVELWGLDFLARGTLSARFAQPVYEGDRVEVRPGAVTAKGGDLQLTLDLVDPDGTVCATGVATLHEKADPGGEDVRLTDAGDGAGPNPEPTAASPESLAVGTVLALRDRTFDADAEAGYLDAVRETLDLYAAERVAHPGWLLRLANSVLAMNVRLGPWIHVGSTAHHLDVVRHGDRLATRAVVTDEWEKKGHRFVALDVRVSRLTDDGPTPVVRIDHTAIYQPRS
ncbi:MAG: hypothetical protein S0880_10125 [Actinomycetota bacterium]|nr:hypothetical protein [Actinomycetota bacterium]